MIINTPISLGELVDKISILMIKKKNIIDKVKLKYVEKELEALNLTLHQSVQDNSIDDYLKKLINVNSELWKVEDDIRECERNKIFDNKFIELARSVYFTNDKRAKLKEEINIKFESQIVEVKSYKEY
jgi:hypothetical protein